MELRVWRVCIEDIGEGYVMDMGRNFSGLRSFLGRWEDGKRRFFVCIFENMGEGFVLWFVRGRVLGVEILG